MSLAIKAGLLMLGAVTTASMLCGQSLRVCADPSNLPYSNLQKEGFENRIAELVAKDLNEELHYFWFPQRENFFRKTLDQGLCDVVIGVPIDMKGLDTTRPYYRSSYVFVTRKDKDLHISSFDDPRLRSLKIGVHVLSEQGDSLPPVYALTSRGITNNLVGISIFGNLNEKEPSTDLLKAVADNQVDIAIAWGPLAGYFAQHSSIPLSLIPVVEGPLEQSLPFHFEIAIGVRKGETALRDTLDAELERCREEVTKILQSYGVPQSNTTSSPSDIRKSEVCGY